MATVTAYHYPNESAPTVSWLPSRCPLLESPREDDDGSILNLAAGGAMEAIVVADPTYNVTHNFVIPWSDVAGVNGWWAFRDALMNREFRVTDELLGGAFIPVRLFAYTRQWTPTKRNGAFWARGTIVMRKVVG